MSCHFVSHHWWHMKLIINNMLQVQNIHWVRQFLDTHATSEVPSGCCVFMKIKAQHLLKFSMPHSYLTFTKIFVNHLHYFTYCMNKQVPLVLLKLDDRYRNTWVPIKWENEWLRPSFRSCILEIYHSFRKWCHICKSDRQNSTLECIYKETHATHDQ